MIRVVVSGTGQMGTLILDTVGDAEDMQPVGILEPIASADDGHTVLAAHADPKRAVRGDSPGRGGRLHERRGDARPRRCRAEARGAPRDRHERDHRGDADHVAPWLRGTGTGRRSSRPTSRSVR